MIYNIHNLVSLEIDKDSRIFSSFDKRLNKFVSRQRCERNIVFKQIQNFNLDGANIIGEFENFFFDEDSLFIEANGGYIKIYKNLIDKDQTIEYEKYADPEEVFSIFGSILRNHLLDEGCSLTHASCVGKNTGAHVFIAWGHTGKTNILLHFLRNGYEYLSDDKIILSKDGYAYPYTLTLNLFDYNLRVHPWLKKYLIGHNYIKIFHFKIKSWIKKRFEYLLRNHIFRPRAINLIFSKIYSFLNSSFFPPVNPEQIDASIKLDRKKISQIFILIRQKGRKNVRIESIKNYEKECNKIVSINDSEDIFKVKNQEFVYRFAFSTKKESNEVEILKNAFRRKKLFKVYLPEEGATIKACKEIFDYVHNDS